MGLPPGGELAISMETGGAIVREVLAPQGFYLEFEDGGILKLPETTVKPFVSEEQLNRGYGDMVPVATPQHRYDKFAFLSELSADEVGKIVPTPVSVQEGEGGFLLSPPVQILHDEGLENETRFLSGLIEDLLGSGPDFLKSDSREVFQTTEDSQSSQSAHQTQTVEFTQPVHHTKTGEQVKLSPQTVRTRHAVQDPPVIHLTDDEGWRLAIASFPELTQVGGRRGHTHSEKGHLVSTYGSGLDPDLFCFERLAPAAGVAGPSAWCRSECIGKAPGCQLGGPLYRHQITSSMIRPWPEPDTRAILPYGTRRSAPRLSGPR